MIPAAHACRLAATLGLALVVSGCAARAVPPPMDVSGAPARYEAARVGRAALARALEADVRLWSSVRGRRLPGVQARMLLGGPDAVRLRVHGLLGAALDGALRGDSLTVHLAALHQGIEVAALGESLGVEDTGALLVTALAAAWTSAGGAGMPAPEIDIAPDALPRGVVWRTRERRFEIRYLAWRHVRGVAWPVHWSLTTDDDAVRIECRVDRLLPLSSLDRERLRVSLPAGIERIAAASIADAWREAP